jgi:hypothetical protein
MNLDLLTNATVVDDAIKFVTTRQEEANEVNQPEYVRNNIRKQVNTEMSMPTKNYIFD